MDEFTGTKIATFRERFSQLCEESPMSATAIAKALHVSKPTISAWKSGDRSPKQPTIITIAEYFGVTIGWLMGFDVKKEAPRPKEERRTPIIVPDTKLFMKITNYMSRDDYDTVMAIFEKTVKTMKEKGLIK